MFRLYKVLLPALVLVGCSSETAILIAVSGGDVDELELRVSVLIDDGTGAYVLDEGLSIDRVDVHGRNLKARPYELLLREEDTSGAPLSLRVLALAYKREEDKSVLKGYAITEPPQAFVREEVLRRTINIVWINAESNRRVESSNNCFTMHTSKEQQEPLTLIASDDRDCDGSIDQNKGGKDCNDEDPSVHPSAPEICDGKDNNCDGKYYAGTTVGCYATLEEQCFAGIRTCDDKNKGWDGGCKTEGEQVAPIFCKLYNDCGSCTDKIVTKTLTCTMARAKSGELCPGGYFPLAPDGATKCPWEVSGSVGLSAVVKGPEGNTEEVKSCEVKLVITEAEEEPTGGHVSVAVYGDSPTVYFVKIGFKIVEICPDQPLSCE